MSEYSDSDSCSPSTQPTETDDELIEDDGEVETEEPIDPAELPPLFSGLDDKETRQQNVERLEVIIGSQPDLAQQHFVPELPHLLDLLRTPDSNIEDGFQTEVLGLISCIFTHCSDSRESVMKGMDVLVAHLLVPDAWGHRRLCVLSMLDTWIGESATARPAIEQAFRTQVFGSDATRSPEEVSGAIETFSGCMIYNPLLDICFDTGAYELVKTAMSSPSEAVCIAAQRCLNSLFSAITSLDDDSSPPALPNRPPPEEIIALFAPSLGDSRWMVARGAAEFFQALPDEIVKGLMTSENSITRYLILQLGKKEILGAPCDYLLLKLTEDESQPLVDAFQALWKASDIPFQDRLAVVKDVSSGFLDLRTAALKGGMSDFLVQSLNNNEGLMEALTVLDKLVNEEQIAGYFVLKTPAIEKLLSILESDSSENRCLAASILTHLCDSRSPDEDSIRQHPLMVIALTADTAYPRVFKALCSTDLKTAGAVANLLGDLLQPEEGSEDWSYEQDSGKPPPACPTKDKLIDANLVQVALTLIQHPDSAVGGMHLIAQCCWGYQRGFDIVKSILEPLVANADAAFFAAFFLDHGGSYKTRQRFRVADALAAAGALEKASRILTSPLPDKEARLQALLGYRLVLTANTVTGEVARENLALPKVFAAIIADEYVPSMRQVAWTFRMIEDENDTTWLDNWKEFGAIETANHLANILQSVVYDPDPEEKDAPDMNALPDDQFTREYKEYTKRKESAKEECERVTDGVATLVKKSLPCFGTNISPLLGPALARTRDVEDMAPVLNEMVAVEGLDLTDLIASIRTIYEGSPPPSIPQTRRWISAGSNMAMALQKAGVDQKLISLIVQKDDVETDQAYDAAIALAELVNAFSDDGLRQETQAAFFSDAEALDVVVGLVDSMEIHGKSSVIDILFTLSKGYPKGENAMKDAHLLPSVITVFEDPDVTVSCVAPLLGLLCGGHEEELATLLRSLFELLHPPSNPDGSGGGKKKKKYRPKVNEEGVWERITRLARTTPAARRAAVNAGLIDQASTILRDKSFKRWGYVLDALRALADTNEGYDDALAPFITRLAEIFLKHDDEAVNTSLFRIVRPLVKTQPQAARAFVLPSIKALGGNAAAFENAMEFICFVASFTNEPATRAEFVQQLHSQLTAEDVISYEDSWGYAFAMSSLAFVSEEASLACLDAGAAQFCQKLFEEKQGNVAARAGYLAAVLMTTCPSSATEHRSRLASLLPHLEDLKPKLAQLSEHKVDEEPKPEGEETSESHRVMYRKLARNNDTFIGALKGEVPEIEDDWYQFYP